MPRSVVIVYVEEGDLDGQTFVAGPFEDEDEIIDAEARLQAFGSAERHILEPLSGLCNMLERAKEE